MHVHVDYDEFYTLPRGQVLIGLADIRRASPTFGKSVQFAWSDKDGVAVVVPKGVAHAVLFEVDSVLVFGLSAYWSPEYDVIGCRFDDPLLDFEWPNTSMLQSERDADACDYAGMIERYEQLSRQWTEKRAAGALMM